MRIAFINQPFDVVWGDRKSSIALWSYRVAMELKHRHDVTIYCQSFGENEPVEKDGIVYRGVDTARDLRRHKILQFLKFHYRNQRAFFATRFFHRNYFRSSASSIAKQSFDVVHIHNFPQAVLAVRRANPRSAIVLHMHCDWLVQLHRPWIEKVMASVDLVIGCSDYVVDEIKQAFPAHAEKCQRLFNGYAAERFYASPTSPPPPGFEKPYLLYLGRGSPEKGVHLAIQAFNRIAREYPDLRLMCVGGIGVAPSEFVYDLVDEAVRKDMAPCFEKPYRDYIYEGISEDVKSRIIEVAHMDYEALPSVYQNAEMLVAPSVFREPFGMHILEAIACGTQIVASRCGGIPDFFIDGKDGLLCERGNLDSLVKHMKLLLKNPAPLRSDEERRESLARFSWNHIASELAGHYQSLS